MKRFACGDVVPECTANWTCPTETEILHRVAAHAQSDHRHISLDDTLVTAVRARIVLVA